MGKLTPFFLMAKMILDYDAISGISHWTDTDEDTGMTYFGADQDATAIFDWNRALYNDDHGKWGEWTHVASIPILMIARLMANGTLDKDYRVLDPDEFRKEMKKVLNDSDYNKIRTRPGVI